MAKKNKPSKLNVEKDISDLAKFIGENDFKSEQELKEFLNQIVGKRIDEVIPKKRGRPSKKDKSMELVFEAHGLPPDEGRKLAQKAIDLYPDNVDAYIYLAEASTDIDLAVDYFQKAIEIAKKLIGEENFKEWEGHFWGVHETRPFMRAKASLAECLEMAEKFDESIKHYKELLALNPMDNQGIRYQLATILVEQNKKRDYLKLYKEFNDDASAMWRYTYAIFLFRTNGRSAKSEKALREAYNENPFVVQFLTGEIPPPEMLPMTMGFGDESEAVHCLNDSGYLWLTTPDALEWVFDFYVKQKKLN
ncbi:MAG: hypothetical protein AAFV95_02815 [Bacteroidota bacterium]